MDEQELRTSFRRGWWVVVGAALLIVWGFFWALLFNRNAPAVTWDLGGSAFVPASSPVATGYYQPVPPAKTAQAR